MIDGKVFRSPCFQAFGKFAMAVLEERPVEKGSVRHGGNLPRVVARHPSLSCRTSPPQGGRLAALPTASTWRRWRLAKTERTADLPPCGGDGRQARGGGLGENRSSSLPLEHWLFLGHERLVGALEIARLHADRLCLRFGLDRLVETHRPFL